MYFLVLKMKVKLLSLMYCGQEIWNILYLPVSVLI